MNAMYRGLSAAYGWTPREIGELTLPQVDAYLSEAKAEGKRTMTAQQYRAWQETRKAK